MVRREKEGKKTEDGCQLSVVRCQLEGDRFKRQRLEGRRQRVTEVNPRSSVVNGH